MKPSRFTEEQIIGIFREQEAGTKTGRRVPQARHQQRDVLQMEGQVWSSTTLQPGSLRVILKMVLEDIDKRALKDGEWKKAIGPALVRAKRLAVQALNKPESQAPKAVEHLREELQKVVVKTDIKHLPANAPIHEGRFVASLDKIQNGKRAWA